jgi:methionyl aminopeptidase
VARIDRVEKITIKSDADIARMKESGRIVARSLRAVVAAMRPGVTTLELDRIAEAAIRSQGAEPSFKGYHGYPAALCVAVNDEVVHGLPGPRQLREGDIVGLDLGAYRDGFHADAALTAPVGEVSREARRLLRVARESLTRGIAQARIGNRVADISAAVQRYAESKGYSVVRDLVGHGIGRQMHEPPQVPNFTVTGPSPELRQGMTLAIEPMVNVGDPEIEQDRDGWTYRTTDGELSAHFEHTVAITAEGPMILTEDREEREQHA